MKYKSTSVNFSDKQKAKIKSAFKQKSRVTIQFSLDLIKSVKAKVFSIINSQLNKSENKKDGQGVRIEFSNKIN